MKKKLIVPMMIALIILASASVTALAAEMPEEVPTPPVDIVVEQLSDEQLDTELGETIDEINALVGDGADDVIDELETELDIDIEDIIDEAEKTLDRTKGSKKTNQNLTNEAREQRLTEKLAKLARLMTEREARVAAKELRVAAADKLQAERQAARDIKVTAADKLQAERQAARNLRVTAADNRQVAKDTN